MFFNYNKNQQKRQADNSPTVRYMWKLLSAYSNREGGAIWVIALAMGLLITLVAVQSTLKASQNKLNTSIEEQKSKAAELAEAGVADYMSFIARNPAIATYCANADSSIANCNTGTSWSNMTPAVITANSNSCMPNITTVVSQIQSAASSSNWQSSGPEGDFRLVSYTYQPDPGVVVNQSPGTATLTVEGRVNDSFNILQVEIPITPFNNPIPTAGLWAFDFTSLTGNARSNAHVKDSSQCVGGTAFDPSYLGTLPNPPFAGEAATHTPSNNIFPELPNNGVYNPPTSGNYNPIACLDLSGNASETFPRNGEIDTNGNVVGSSPAPPADATYIYVIDPSTCGGNAIDLTGNASIAFGQSGQETIHIYTSGVVNLAGNGNAQPASSGGNTTKVIWFLNNNLRIVGNGDTYHPTFFQFYVYGTRNVTLSGNGASSAFIFAPNSHSRLNGNAEITGALWSNSVDLIGNAKVNQILTDTDFSNLELFTAGGIIRTNQVNSVISRQRISK